MSRRVWIYDRTNDKGYREQVQRAKDKGRVPPGRWWVRYYDKLGKVRTETLPTKRKAQDRRDALAAALQSGTYVDPSSGKIKLSEMAEKWLDSRHDIKPSTWWKYRSLLDNHVNPEWGDVRLSDIETEDIATWVSSLLKPDDEEDRNALGPSQTRQAFRVLAMVLGWCVPRRLKVNPATGVKLPVLPEAEHVYLTYQQVEALADAAADLQTKYNRPTASASVNRALILLLAYTGIRLGEAFALRVRHVDLGNRRVRIAATAYEIKGGIVEGLPKSGKRRTVSFPASLVSELRPLIEGRDSAAHVFTTERRGQLRKSNWRAREFVPAVQAAGLDVEGLVPHKLRHTAASLAIAAGADVKVVQQMLGHADASMTLNIYGHLFPDRLDEVADVLDLRRQAARDDKSAA